MSKHYEYYWTPSDVVFGCGNLRDLIDSLRYQANRLEKMADDGIKIDPASELLNPVVVLWTKNPEIANQHGFSVVVENGKSKVWINSDAGPEKALVIEEIDHAL